MAFDIYQYLKHLLSKTLQSKQSRILVNSNRCTHKDTRFLLFTVYLYKMVDKILSHPFNEYNIDSKYPAVKHTKENLGHKICFKIIKKYKYIHMICA